ncbi:serine/threonine-protein kinase [Limnoglobus roseus]|uniref:Serine/threonine protein kinase n=1 Tax=Limnoglobus roseus TaxID=2598579 RepID=A0A5C1AQ13_9BACT|nr:serine/threonine-protein kinase [Limnoglobus roseus]QEL20267.1 serine/threonine protein kinase [Limnoglobus roseus]
MPSESVATFLTFARDNRLLPTEQVQELVRQSEVPQAGLPALCDALVSRGLLTPFQATCIREGRGQDLSFAGYPVLDDLGPCPGGFAQKARHPSLRTPLIIRRLSVDWLAPADNLSAYIQRAQQVSTLTHQNLAMLLDAGAYEDQLFAVLEPYEGAHLDSLVRDIGPMPAFLACAFGRQAAMGLDAAHRTGYAHGDVRPANLYVSPLTQSSRVKADGSPLFRPAPTSGVKVAEFGLVPRRPPMGEWIVAHLESPGALAYLPPERVASAEATPAGDVYGLGLSLCYLLTAAQPFQAATAADMLAKIAGGAPLPLAALRPDLPPELIALVGRMIAKSPAERPPMNAVIDRLGVFISPISLPVAPTAPPPTAESSILDNAPPQLRPNASPAPSVLLPVEPPAEWTVTPYQGSTGDGEMMFAPAAALAGGSGAGMSDFAASGAVPARRRRMMSAAEATKEKKKWLMIALGLWVVSIPLWIILLYTWGVLGGGSRNDAGNTKPTATPNRGKITH